MVPVPFNLTSLERLLPDQAEELKALLVAEFGMDVKVPVSALRKHADERIREFGEFVFENVYLNYTTKQWGDKPENLDFETITARVPVHISYDDRYFQEQHQALPKDGYTKMFERMLANPLIEVRLSTKAVDVLSFEPNSGKILFMGEPYEGGVIYTGPIDELLATSSESCLIVRCGLIWKLTMSSSISLVRLSIIRIRSSILASRNTST